jgi:hypothetical protein
MLSGIAKAPRELQPSLPEPAALAIQTAINPAPAQRFAGAREFAAAFTSVGKAAREQPRGI